MKRLAMAHTCDPSPGTWGPADLGDSLASQLSQNDMLQRDIASSTNEDA